MKYCGTPPVHLLFGLRKSLDMLFEKAWKTPSVAELLAGATQAAVGRWREAGASRLQYPRAIGTLADGDRDPP